MSRHCVTDNGPQFVSYEYARFARQYGFTSIKSSRYHSRGNGKAESAVKIAKNFLRKSRFEDLYLALLAYRNTPQQGYQYSPAQRLFFSFFINMYKTNTSYNINITLIYICNYTTLLILTLFIQANRTNTLHYLQY